MIASAIGRYDGPHDLIDAEESYVGPRGLRDASFKHREPAYAGVTHSTLPCPYLISHRESL